MSTVIVLAIAVAARIAWRRGARLMVLGFGTFAVVPALALLRTTSW